MSVTEVETPKTDLNSLDKETLVGLVEAGFAAHQIKAMQDPKVQLFALQNDMNYQELSETIKLLADIRQMESHSLSVFKVWVGERGITLSQLQHVAKRLQEESLQIDISDRRRWLENNFYNYTKARDQQINHIDLIQALGRQADLGVYRELREIELVHNTTLRLIKEFGKNAIAIRRAKESEVGDTEIRDFLKHSGRPGYHPEYLELRKAEVSHEEAMAVVHVNLRPKHYLSMKAVGLTHQEVLLLCASELHRSLFRTFYEDRGVKKRREISLDSREIALLCDLPKKTQAVVKKVIEYITTNG